MAQGLWEERKRLYLLSYNELLYLLNKYPKAAPYQYDKSSTTKDQYTQTSPHRFNRYMMNNNDNNMHDTNNTDSTLIMTPSPASKANLSKSRLISRKQLRHDSVSPVSSTSTTVIMSPSPETKRKRQCNPFIITPPSKQILSSNINHKMRHNENNNNDGNKSIKAVHASAMKLSHTFLNSLIDQNNDSENETEKQSQTKIINRMKRKRSFQQLMDNEYDGEQSLNNTLPLNLSKTFSECSINENNRPLKRRKICHKSKANKPSPEEHRKQMLLQYYNMNRNNNHKPCKPKLVRSNNKNMPSNITAIIDNNNHKKPIKPKLVRSNKKNIRSNITAIVDNNSNTKPIKPRLERANKYHLKPNVINSKLHDNNNQNDKISVNITKHDNKSNTKRKLIFNDDKNDKDGIRASLSNSYESIESASPHPVNEIYNARKSNTCNPSKVTIPKIDKKRSTKKKKKRKPKMSTIPRRLDENKTMNTTPEKVENTNNNKQKTVDDNNSNKKKKRRRSSLALQEARDPDLTDNDIDDATFFGLLPELDEQDIKQCDDLANSLVDDHEYQEEKQENKEKEEKQMSNNEIIRFENKISDISPIPRYRHSKYNNTLEQEWKVQNQSVPDHTQQSEMIITTKQSKYTPLWKASMNLPVHEKHFDINKLKASNDPHPFNRFNEQYLNNEDISPQTKLAQNSLRSDIVINEDEDEDNNVIHSVSTHSQIVAKYQKNVTCFVNKIDDNNDIENNMESDQSKQSLFENTDFSANHAKINSLLAESAESNDQKYFDQLNIGWKNKNKNEPHKYSVFPYPKDSD